MKNKTKGKTSPQNDCREENPTVVTMACARGFLTNTRMTLLWDSDGRGGMGTEPTVKVKPELLSSIPPSGRRVPTPASFTSMP